MERLLQTVLAGVYAERDSLAAQLEALRNAGDSAERSTAVGEAGGELGAAVGLDTGGIPVWQPRTGRQPVRVRPVGPEWDPCSSEVSE